MSARAGATTGTAGARPGRGVEEIQRSRLVAAVVGVVGEQGLQVTTVGEVTARARVSRRTFYELFGNLDACLEAAFEEIVWQVEGRFAAAGGVGLPWRERMRAGLWALLSFFDREPLLARVCVVESAHGGPLVLARREAALARLAGAVDEGRLERRGGAGARCGELTAEGLVGAVLAIVQTRVMREDSPPLAGLLGELMGLLVLPYLGPAAARRERERPLPAPLPAPVAGGGRVGRSDPLVEVPMRLTYRTSRVLLGVGELSAGDAHPSNRQIADFAEIPDPGQVSKLLARLERLGLLVNTSTDVRAKGEPNAWALTATGERVTQSIRAHGRHEQRAA